MIVEQRFDEIENFIGDVVTDDLGYNPGFPHRQYSGAIEYDNTDFRRRYEELALREHLGAMDHRVSLLDYQRRDIAENEWKEVNREFRRTQQELRNLEDSLRPPSMGDLYLLFHTSPRGRRRLPF